MELRDLIKLFVRERLTYGLIIGLFLVAGFVFINYEPQRYQAKLLLTIGRTEGQPTAEYSYDSFYRLQADERFADTLVQLLGTARVTEDIFQAADRTSTQKEKYFTARRLSSQVVEVSFESGDKNELSVLGKSLSEVLARYTNEFNAKETVAENWFQVTVASPVIEDARTDARLVIALAFFAGIFVGFWLILFKHYLRES